MMRKLLAMGIFALLSGASALYAQQDPQYTMYMYNQNVINPAYAGTQENLRITSLYRQQWSGVEGAPETLTFSGSMPVGDRVGVGLSVISDQIGPVQEKNFYGDFSYKLQVGKKTTLALGIKAGLTFHDVNLATIQTTVPGDDAFANRINDNYFNIGTGAFLYSDNWYVGASVPNLLSAVHLDESENDTGTNLGSETQHFFLTAGYVFDINENVKLKPHALVKGAFDAPFSFDINTNALFYDKFELGVSYRYEDSFSGLAAFQLNQNIKAGYAYDRVVSDIQVASNSSHELFVVFDLNFPRKVMQSPRFF